MIFTALCFFLSNMKTRFLCTMYVQYLIIGTWVLQCTPSVQRMVWMELIMIMYNDGWMT